MFATPGVASNHLKVLFREGNGCCLADYHLRDDKYSGLKHYNNETDAVKIMSHFYNVKLLLKEALVVFNLFEVEGVLHWRTNYSKGESEEEIDLKEIMDKTEEGIQQVSL